VVALPISLWSYKTQSTSIRHIGPMAQDFYTTFGLGTDDRYISTVDIEGVALAAIQGVNQIMHNQADQIAAQQQQIATLESEIAAQRTQLTEIEARLSALEQNKTITTPTLAGSSWEWLLFAIVGLIGLSGIQRAIRQGRRSS
jgi:1-deoxy-D-xylulose 5-phosphate reductoisomerase